MRNDNKFTWDQDWPLAWLVWSPKGIEQYLKEGNRFQRRFGGKYNRENVAKVIESVVGKDAIKNKNTPTMQNFASYYNTVDRGEAKKTDPCRYDPLGKTFELVKIFAIHPPTRIEGLYDHIEDLSFEGKKGFFKELLDLVKAEHDKEVDSLKDSIAVADLLEEYYRKIIGNMKAISKEHMTAWDELKDILQNKLDEQNELIVQKEFVIDETIKHFKSLPDDPKILKKEIFKYLNSLK